MNLHDAAQRFQLQLHADGRAEATRLQYARHLALLIGWLKHQKHSRALQDIDDQVVASFLASSAARLRPDGRAKKASSTNALRSSVRCFFKYCTEAGLVVQDPARLVRLAITSAPPPRALRSHEQAKLRKVLEAAEGDAAQRDRALVEFLSGTGARLSSALALTVGDLDLSEGVAHLRSVKRGREQTVYLPGKLRALLAGYLGDRRSGALFAGRSGEHLTTRHLQRRFRMWRERAGIADSATLHGLRHSFALWIYRQTHDLLVVQSALGHAALSSSLAYARVDDSRVREVVAGLHGA
jgi:integrase/recombinase XerC